MSLLTTVIVTVKSINYFVKCAHIPVDKYEIFTNSNMVTIFACVYIENIAILECTLVAVKATKMNLQN